MLPSMPLVRCARPREGPAPPDPAEPPKHVPGSYSSHAAAGLAQSREAGQGDRILCDWRASAAAAAAALDARCPHVQRR